MSEWNVKLDPPAQLRDGDTEFGSKRQINDWIDTLPAAATGEATRRIYLALHELGEHQINPSLRFYFLEKSNPVFISLLRGLERTVYRGGFPLNELNTKTAHLLLRLMALNVVNYRLVLEGLQTSLLAGGLKRQHMQRLSILRIIELIGEIFELYRHLDIAPCKGLWLAFHRFFSLAEVENLLERQLPAIDGSNSTCIGTEFKLQHLLNALNPHDFRYSEYQCAKMAIRHFVKGMPLTRQGDINSPESFCLNLDEDAALSFLEPVRALQHEPSPRQRCLNIHPLRAKLQHFLNEEYDTHDLMDCQFSRHSARIMLDGWQVYQDPHALREASQQNIRFVHGLSNIVQMLSRAPIPQMLTDAGGDTAIGDGDYEVVIMEHEPLPEDFAADVEGLDLNEHREKMEQEADDVWTPAPINITKPASSWLDNFRKDNEAAILSARLLDRSPSGFGVELEASDATKGLLIGELIAVEVDDDWQLASVRWIRNDEETLHIGLRLVGQQLRPQTLVVNRRGQPSQPMPVLHIIHQRGLPAIVLHNINIHSRDSITFADGEEKVRISLGELLDSSAVFECYQLDRSTIE